MASGGGSLISSMCTECGRQVDILNDDVQFSMEVHMQSHKSLEMIAQEIDSPSREVFVVSNDSIKSSSNYTCPDCKGNFEILNSDVNLSFQLHAQKHKSDDAEIRSEDCSPTSSGNSKRSKRKCNLKSKENSQPVHMSVLDSIFSTLPPVLQSHRGFVVENSSGGAVCNICTIKITPILNLCEHLKTKLHEDNTITFLKEKLSADLYPIMEFVSFYSSNLCCNLCKCEINLSSNNPYETIVNVMAHNSAKVHLSNKTRIESCYQPDEALSMLNYFALINPLINDNKHLIEYELQPQFKCKLCNKNIAYNKSEYELLCNVIEHFSTAVHKENLRTSSILQSFEASYSFEKSEHNFIILDGCIHCTVCHFVVQKNIDQLVLHVKGTHYFTPKNETLDLVTRLTQLSLNASTSTTKLAKSSTLKETANINKEQTVLFSTQLITERETNNTAKQGVHLKDLLNCLPVTLKHTNCIAENEQGQVTCLICNCTIPAATYNIETHLLGRNHSLNKQSRNPNNENVDENNAVKKLFQMLPLSHQNSIEFIRASPNKTNTLYSSVCKANVSANNNSLQKHLEGGNHITLVEQYNTSCQVKRSDRILEEDVLFLNIVKSNKVINRCAKYLIRKDNNYFCNLCKHTIVRSNDKELFRQNLLSHVEGRNHFGNKILNELQLSDPIIRDNISFLNKKKNNFFCTLCACTIAVTNKKDTFRIHLVSHLAGNKHVKNAFKLSLSS